MSLRCRPSSFASIQPMGWEMLFEEFQDGRHGGSLKIWNGTILAILNLYVAPMPPIQFCLHPTYGLASCKSALNPPVVYSTDRSKAVVPVLVLLFVALWFILRGDLLYVFPCVILFLCFSVLLVLRLPRLGKRELI